jgi:hypothetical protein
MYVTIPEITESEEIDSFTVDPDGLTFHVVMGVGATASRLQQIASNGEHLPLVVIASNQFISLHSVYVSGFSVAADTGDGRALASVSFLAREVELT